VGSIIQHHIVELCIVVRNAFGYRPLLLQIEQHVGHRLAPQGKLYLGRSRLGSIQRVGLHRRGQCRIALRRVVKIGDRVVQPGQW